MPAQAASVSCSATITKIITIPAGVAIAQKLQQLKKAQAM
jgi:hypothetical protein